MSAAPAPAHKPTTLLALWTQFEVKVLPLDAPPVQRQEMKRAFYAGAFTLFCELVSASGADEVAAERYLSDLRDEMVSFLSAGGIAKT